ncbi:putative stress responsive a b barrel domain-containing protein [Botrytis fragariae]|uniref:Putative stress responsive a b barrel domain-containing protein n=1 Tax=Botrytis fragariae TaxID=1964551 RepID=A0A8H6ASU2_9HELO|nr:putative stress responsive a b barrel domain-containing protein [Botrytis fragariae]KAF5872982.1 putative stress responsive a b barrel domain-containing protein [Botrytis fragariae]
MAGIIRITMFKVPSQASRDTMLKNYETLSKKAVKDSAPGESQANDPRTQGFSVVAKTEFKNLEDMEYYEDSCEAHKWFKGEAKTLGVEGMCCVYYEPSVVA